MIRIGLALLMISTVACAAAQEETEGDEQYLTTDDAEIAKIRKAVKDVDQAQVVFSGPPGAIDDSAGSGAISAETKTSLFDVDWNQKWAGGKVSDHDWASGTDAGKRCMWAGVARFEELMKAPPPEFAAFVAEFSSWDGSFNSMNDDYAGKSEDGTPAVGDAKGARLAFAPAAGRAKWGTATAKDGSCFLPTRALLVEFAKQCTASAKDGVLKACEAR